MLKYQLNASVCDIITLKKVNNLLALFLQNLIHQRMYKRYVIDSVIIYYIIYIFTNISQLLESEEPLEIDNNTMILKSITQYKEEQKEKKKKISTEDIADKENNIVDTNKKNKSIEYVQTPYQDDSLIKVNNLNENCTREILQRIIEKCGGKIHYIDYSRGLNEACIQLSIDTPIHAKDICTMIKNSFDLKNNNDEEKKLYNDLATILSLKKSTDGDDEEKVDNTILLPTFINFEDIDDAKKIWETIETARLERRSMMNKNRKRDNGSIHHSHPVKRSRPIKK